jgi:hypothetical protein
MTITLTGYQVEGLKPVEWVGGQPIGETFLRRVNRTTARTLVEVDVPGLPPAVARDVECWVEHQMYSMPFHVKLGVAVVAVVVTLHSLLRTGRPPWRLPPSLRHHLLKCWSSSPLAPVAQYVRLERSLVLFASFERLAVTT